MRAVTAGKPILRAAARIAIGVVIGVALIAGGLMLGIYVRENKKQLGGRSVSARPTAAKPPASAPEVCSPDQIRDALSRDARLKANQLQFSRAGRRLESDDLGFELWATSFGEYWVPRGESSGLFFIMAEQALDIYRVPEAGVRPGDVVLDVGASYGEFTRKALKEGAAKVVAIDPSPRAVTCLRRNLAPEIASGRVILVDKGAWDREEMLDLDVPGNTSPRTRVVAETGATSDPRKSRVPLTTIDSMVSGLGLRRVDFIKMDIEGGVPKALVGAAATLSRFRPRMAICVYHETHHPILIPNLIQAAVHGYRQRTVCYQGPDGRVFPDVTFFW